MATIGSSLTVLRWLHEGHDMRLQIGDCCAPCELDSVTLKRFSKSDGTEVWQHRLDNPVMSSDMTHIYGYAFEQDDSDAAKACLLYQLAGTGSGGSMTIAASPTIRRFKKWVRKIDIDGTVIGDSAFWWYTGNNSFYDSPLELPDNAIGWVQDCFGASGAGELLNMSGDNRTGSVLGLVIVWDSNNITTTRRYTILASALQNLATVPTGGAKLRVVAEADGTNAEQTIDVLSMIGKTAADLATDLEAFPHIISATGTGGPYPLQNITLEIEWATDSHHFKSMQRLTTTDRSWSTWLRDWDTAAITAVVQPSGSTAVAWQLDGSDNVIGLSTNPNAGLNVPGNPFAIIPGCAVEKFTRTTGPPDSYGISWRTRPTQDYPRRAGGLTTYRQPVSIRAGRLVVCHDMARGSGQGPFDVCETNELDMSTGAVLSYGGTSQAFNSRPSFTADDQLFEIAWTHQFAPEAPPSYYNLKTGLVGYSRDYFGAYGLYNIRTSAVVADTQSMYAVYGQRSGGTSGQIQQMTWDSGRVGTLRYARSSGYVSRVDPDGFFSLQRYYRLQYTPYSPFNYRWKTSGLQWRVAWHLSGSLYPSPANSDSPQAVTAWLDFDADEADLLAALLAVVGNNDAGPNAFVSSPIYMPQGSDEPMPCMIWQRGITITITAEQPFMPAATPPVVWNLADREIYGNPFIQIRSTAAADWTEAGGLIMRMDWVTGDVIWDTPFGQSSYGGQNVGGNTGMLFDDTFIVAGGEVNGTCYSAYQWQELVYGTPEWVLVADYCPTGRTPSPPSGDGAFIGEYKHGTCVR